MTAVFISSGYAIRELFLKGASSKRAIKLSVSSFAHSCGYTISSIEMINHVLNLRRFIRHELREQFSSIGYGALFFCSLMMVLPSLLIFQAYEGKDLPSIYFMLFQHNIVVKLLYFSMGTGLIYGLAIYTIFNVEMLEKIKLFQSWVRNEQKELSSLKIYVVRVGFLCLVGLLASCFEDIRIVYSIAGIFINSVIALVVPGYCAFIRSPAMKARDSFHDRWLDKTLIYLGVGVILLYLGEAVLK